MSLESPKVRSDGLLLRFGAGVCRGGRLSGQDDRSGHDVVLVVRFVREY